jgi:hypothetical protein
MKEKIVVFGLIALALAATMAVTTPKTTQAQEYDLILSENIGPVGTRIKATGTGADPDEWIDLYWYNPATGKDIFLEDNQADGAGEFTIWFNVPEDRAGPHAVRAIAKDGAPSWGATFTVVAKIMLSPDRCHYCENVTITGTGFENDSSITITFDEVAIPTTPSVVTSNENGSFTAIFHVPEKENGPYPVRAVDINGNENTENFTVCTWIVLSENEGSYCDNVTIWGYGFGENENVAIHFDGDLQTTVLSNENGSFTVTNFHIPSKGVGGHWIWAVDTFRAENSKLFTIVPKIWLSENVGRYCENITVVGRGFLPLGTVTIWFDNENVAWPVAVDENGYFEENIHVGYYARGIYPITAEDTDWNSATEGFEVLPWVWLNNYTIRYSQGYVAYIRGFVPNSPTTIYLDNDPAAVSPTTNDNGGVNAWSWDIPTTFPPKPAGPHTFKVVDNDGNENSKTVTVVPWIWLEKDNGRYCENIRIQGWGFAANANVTIYFGTDNQKVVTTDENGSFDNFFHVDEAPAGPITIRAVDNAANENSKLFTVLPWIEISDNEGTVCTDVVIWGWGFKENDNVTIYFADENVQWPVSTDENGSFITSIHIDNTPNCIHAIKAVDTDGNENSKNFKVLANVWLDETEGYYCENIGIHGTGFDNNATVTVTLDGRTILTTTTDENGSFDDQFHIDNIPYGSYTVTASTSVKATDSTTFNILAWIWLDENEGHYCENIGIHGRGFDNNAPVTVTLAGIIVLTGITTDENGSFDDQFHIDNAPNGVQTVKAWTSLGAAENSKTITIQAWIWLDENVGHYCENIGIHGRGFDPNDYAAVYINGRLLDNFPTDSNGSFDNQFHVPTLPAGTYTVKATTSPAENSKPFTVVPWITIDPENVWEHTGAIVTVRGYSFDNFAQVTITIDNVELATGVITDENGSFTKSVYIWPLMVGQYTIKAVDNVDNENSKIYTVTYWLDVTVTPMGTEYYRGDNARFNVLTAFHGENVAATLTSALLFKPTGTTENLLGNVQNLGGGLFRIWYALPDNAPFGSYALKVSASYTHENVEVKGTGVGSFQVNPTAENIRRYVIIIENNTLWIMDYLENTVKVEIENIENMTARIEGNTLWIMDKIENTVIVKLENLENFSVRIENNTLWIMDYLENTVKVDLDNILAYSVRIESNTLWIMDYLENTVKVDLDNILAYSVRIESNTLWIMDYLENEIEVKLDNLKTISLRIENKALWIMDYLENTVKVDLDNILAYSVRIEGNTLWIMDYLENTVKVDLDNILAYSVRIESNTLWIMDYLENTVKVDLDNILAYSVTIEGNTLWIMDYLENEIEIKLDNIKNIGVRIENKALWIMDYLENTVKVDLNTLLSKTDNILGHVDKVLDNVLYIKNYLVGTIKVDLDTLLTDVNTIIGIVGEIKDNVLYVRDYLVGEIELKLDNLLGWLDNYENDMLWIRTTLGTILSYAENIDARTTTIRGKVATIETNVGTILTTVNTINAKLTTLDGRVATIVTDLGTIKTDISDIRLRITSISGDIATIETTLGTIEGEIVSIDRGVATVRTALGTVQAQIPEIASTTKETSTNIWLAAALIIVVVGLLALIIRKRPSPS